MAAELVGGALLSSFLQVAFDRLASPEILDYFKGRNKTETLLKKMKYTLLVIDAVIDDAENKEIMNQKVKAWVDEVKDAAYEADDLLDEIDMEVFKRQQMEAEGQSSNSSKVWKFFDASVSLFDKEIESRIKHVLDNLEYLASQKDILGLRENNSVGVGLGRMLKVCPTTSLVDEEEICGRNDEKENIIKWLLSQSEMGNCPYSVISVVAMGGMGKTTLAQLVYNDERMANEFEIKAWVYVSEEFDVVRVTRTILEAITSFADDTKDKNLLQLKLKEKLVGKRFFLVLDDVWNENYLNWEDLQKPFHEGAKGSKIFVTSRNYKVVETMRSTKIILLDELSKGDSWLLFSKHAFHVRNLDSNPCLEEIGRKIQKKCKGLPLALKTIGSLLYSDVSFERWNNVLTSEIWDISYRENDIMPVLRLSYNYLPSNLKRCFAYCSLFPKGYRFDREHLIWLWMGENLLNCSKHNKSIKEVGDHYFSELLSRSFFQNCKINNNYFIMHDLITDLAKYVSGEFYFKLEGKEAMPQTISEKTRHFSFVSYDGFPYNASKQFKPVYTANRLRTFLSLNMYKYGFFYKWICPKMLDDFLSRLKCLRVLSLNSFNITELPDSVGKLKHLRYLDLSWTEIVKLPDSICSLYNLQILKLRFCICLVELPLDLHKLVNLCYLNIQGTRVRKMPKKLEKLKKLQVLTSFFIGKDCESDIKQLADLHYLGGELSVLELQNVDNPMDALAMNLKKKIHVEKLMLGWNIDNDESEKERNVLEKLQPHQNLKELSVQYYGGTRFPGWFGDRSLQNLVSLKLCNCKYCFLLPSLGLLSSLKTLSILGFDSIVNIGHEFYGDIYSTIPFRSLERLMFENMEGWEDWECKDVPDAFPVLEILHIINCPSLKEQLPVQLPSLRSLEIKGCDQLTASVPYTTTVLESLTIIGCNMARPFLESIEHTIPDSCLKELRIDGCLNMEFPLHHCHEFLIAIYLHGSCQSLTTFPLDFFPKLQVLSLRGCCNLEMISVSEGHDYVVTSILRLAIWDCPKFASFPKGGLFAPKLWSISILGSENLKSLPERMDTLLPSLVYLKLRRCPRLECLPKEGLPSSLRDLEIIDCPLLPETWRYQ